MPSPDSGNRIAERQRSPEAVELLRAFHHSYGSAKHWHAARLAGTVLVALAAPVVIIFAPYLEHPLGAIAGAWVLASRLVLRPAQERATGFAVAVQEMFDRQVLGLPAARTPQPPAYEQIHQQARRCRSDPDRDWYSVRPQLPSGSAVLIAQRSGTVWSRRLYQEWAVVLAALAGGWTLLTVIVAAARGATVGEYLIAVLLPMLPALLDATDLCQAHCRAAAERSGLEAAIDQRLDAAAQGRGPALEDLRTLQDEINRQRLTQPPVPDWYYRLRRASYETSMHAAAGRLAERLDAARSV
ncbi:MAG: S-4TM family putative pore-forming effector [Actinomycetota bacterium]|nr:S-4TM family putative pore-forming effector [Actinomycetota bacterium]